jgi:hypothetical protein
VTVIGNVYMRNNMTRVEALTAANPDRAAGECLEAVPVLGEAVYEGLTYYVRTLRPGGRLARLVSRDGRYDFWATCSGPKAFVGDEADAAVVRVYDLPVTLGGVPA